MRFRFNEAKTAQAAAYILKLHGKAMSYMVLIKLLYLADRRMLLAHGQPISGDKLVAMKHGPVLSRVFDFITHGPKRNTDAAWFNYIDAPAGYDVALKQEAPTDELSRYELRLLEEVHTEFGQYDRWDLVDLLHKIIPEWQDPGSSSETIEYVDILRAEDRSPAEIERVKRDADAVWFLDSLA